MKTDSGTRIRPATASDAGALAQLLAELGYPGTEAFIAQKIAQQAAHPDALLLVATEGERILGLISLHFIPQLALPGDFCRISYFCVSETARGRGIGAQLERRAESEARARHCDRIELHCHSRRTGAHRFYARQGYEESPKYFMKTLTELTETGSFAV
ncbi:GNAT family N-acetyltransferase [Noviherbaspirillum massiliense]|uniref:GNAT family N-acetyltransferase n=1 Tax=Noviherbaspirillum massiliense TaxID=1465823 RepID=UPI0003178BF0|nr:GNAT family N-acetyltransferase [Noviherbaspirillum massiliense]